MAETKMYTYRAKDGVDRFIPGIGRSVGGILKSPYEIENPNFELVENEAAPASANDSPAPSVPVVPAVVAQPAVPASPVPPAPANNQVLNTETKE